MKIWKIDWNKSAANNSILQKNEKIDENINDVNEKFSNISFVSSTTWIKFATISQRFSIDYCIKIDESDVKNSFDSEITKYDVV